MTADYSPALDCPHCRRRSLALAAAWRVLLIASLLGTQAALAYSMTLSNGGM